MLDMWFRPRGEMMPLDTHFWEIAKDPHDAWCNIALAILNFALRGCRRSRGVADAASHSISCPAAHLSDRALVVSRHSRPVRGSLYDGVLSLRPGASRGISGLVLKPKPTLGANHLASLQTQQGRSRSPGLDQIRALLLSGAAKPHEAASRSCETAYARARSIIRRLPGCRRGHSAEDTSWLPPVSAAPPYIADRPCVCGHVRSGLAALE